MRVFVPSAEEFFAWLHTQGYRYAVLRRFYAFDTIYPNIAPAHELDMLADDAALTAIDARYGKGKKGQGIECDIYNVSGNQDGGELGIPYFPPVLSEAILNGRRLWKNRFYVPDARTHLASLLYHICYRKAESSGIHEHDPTQSANSKYLAEIGALTRELGIEIPASLRAYDTYLRENHFEIPYAYLPPLLQDQFRRHVKSPFMAYMLHAHQRGEMNMFVIRSIALKVGLAETILQTLRQHYTILSVKPIPWLTRLRTRKRMRGGKWRFGGWPCIAVIVYDPAPQARDASDGGLHPLVFNRRQFFKPALREWFSKESGCRIKLNPIHSTDNEAEALGHLHLFFSPQEQADLLQTLAQLRAQ